MLVFSAEIPLRRSTSTSVDTLVFLLRSWLIGSPHYQFSEDTLGFPPEASIDRFSVGSESAELGRIQTERGEIVGLRHTRIEEDSLEWRTEVVGATTENDFRVAVRVHCERFLSAPGIPRVKKPYIVRQVVQALSLEDDSGLEIGERPLFLCNTEDDLVRATAMMRGTFGNALPVIYASATASGRPLIDPHRIAARVSGLAHVVVEHGRVFSHRLKDRARMLNVYGGGVGIYWPEGDAFPHRFHVKDFSSSASMEREVESAVIDAVTNKRVSGLCTWAGLCEHVSRREIRALTEAGSSEVENYVKAFDAEKEAAAQALRDSEQELLRLQAELRRARRQVSSASSRGDGILADGQEQELFPGERRAHLLAVLNEALKNGLPDSRRAHLIEGMITTMMDPDDVEDSVLERMSTSIKRIFKGYTTLTGSDRQELKALGFSMTSAGKHIKMTFGDDSRYTFTAAKSCSDHRGGDNLASTINRRLF